MATVVRARLREQWDVDQGRGVHAGSRPFALYGSEGEAAAGSAAAQMLRRGLGEDEQDDLRPRPKPLHQDDKVVPVQSFMDDLDRKLSLRKVMGKPDQNKFQNHRVPQDADADQDGIDAADQLYHQPEQFTKEEVNYRYSGNTRKMCGVCKFYVDPGACKIVAGIIRPVDVCDKFEERRAELTTGDRMVRARVANEAATDTWPGAGMRGDNNPRVTVPDATEGTPVARPVRAKLAEWDGFGDNGGDEFGDQGDDEFDRGLDDALDECPDDVRDLFGHCPGDPDYDPSTVGMFASDAEAGTFDPMGLKITRGDEQQVSPPPSYPGSAGINTGGQGRLVKGQALTHPTMARLVGEQQRSWITADRVAVAQGRKAGVSVTGGVQKTVTPLAPEHGRVSVVDGKAIKVHTGREGAMGRGREGSVVHFEPDKPHEEVSPPGWGGTVKAMKKYMSDRAMAAIGEAMRQDMRLARREARHEGENGKGRITNPWALAWYMKGKGMKPHYPDKGEARRETRREAAGVRIEKGRTTGPARVAGGRTSGVKVVRATLAG